MNYILSINTTTVKQSILSDFTIINEAKNNSEYFIKAGLEKKDYLKLLKIYHPDVAVIDETVALTVAQKINAAKDGKLSDFDFNEWYEQHQETEAERQAREKDFAKRVEIAKENLRNSISKAFWTAYGGIDSFSINPRSFVNASRRMRYSCIDTSIMVSAYYDACSDINETIERVWRGALSKEYRCKVNWMEFKKDDLLEIFSREGWTYFKSWNKARLVSTILKHTADISISDKSYSIRPYYGLLKFHELVNTITDPEILYGIHQEREQAREEARKKQDEATQAE